MRAVREPAPRWTAGRRAQSLCRRERFYPAAHRIMDEWSHRLLFRPHSPKGQPAGQARPPLPPSPAHSRWRPRSAALAALRALGYNRPPKASRPSIRGRALSVERAVQESGSLAQLTALARESQLRLQSLQRVLPPLLWAQLSAGPIEADTWCVLVSNNAVAAKIRQWVPAMAAHLRTRGWAVQTIRIKVRSSR